MTQVAFQFRKSTRKKIDSPIAVTFCVALALLGCAEAEDSAGDAGVILGWIYDGEQGCLEQASPQVALADSLLLDEMTPTLGPGGVCWVLPRSQLPQEGWVELNESQLPASCPDLMDVPFCGPFCPHSKFHGQRYDQSRQCLEQDTELWCRPVNAGGGDAMTNALAPDGTCWLLPNTQMPAEDWTNLDENPSEACPNLVDDGVVECDADGEVDSGLLDSGMSVPHDAQVSDGAAIGDGAMSDDAAINDAAIGDAMAGDADASND